MARGAQGRGIAAVFGVLLILAGLVGGGLLLVTAQRRPARAVDGYARAPIGCTTTLEFTETGTFYVFQESAGGQIAVDGGCVPLAADGQAFGFELTGSAGPVVPQEDATLTYDTGTGSGTSIASIDVGEPGEYRIAVVGDDVAVRAAIGRAPRSGVAQLRRGGVLVALAGLALGGLLLVASGRRSKRIGAGATDAATSWGSAGDLPPVAGSSDPTLPPVWPPEPPHVTAPSRPATWAPPDPAAVVARTDIDDA